MSPTGRPTSVSHLWHRRVAWTVLLAAAVLSAGGCASSRGVSLRSIPQNPLADSLKLTARSGPRPSPRTVQVLRVCNLRWDADADPRQLLQNLQTTIEHDPSPEKVYAFAELAYMGGRKAEEFDTEISLDLYGAAVLYAYHYLFDEHFAGVRNPYDPQFRGACDLYNGALEGALRIACKQGELVPGNRTTIHTAAGSWDITCVLRGSRWRAEDFGGFKFVSDYEIKGLKNHYRTYGLGVPLIAVRRRYEGEPAAARYYPEGLSFPVTAFLRPTPRVDPLTGRTTDHHQCVLELYDPLITSGTTVAGRQVALQSDLSTPLAYFLSNPQMEDLATVGLLRPDVLLKLQPGRQTPLMGLYMVQPYEPGKIPVLMVHGLWSSPMTWMEMFNDLRNSPAIRDHYQFWFYLYPSGQPFWISAAQLREDLLQARRLLDPQWQEPALDQMVLVGHSMGGLIARLQTINSRTDFWNLASEKPLDALRAEPEERQTLQKIFFFQPSPSIRRVITIGTPHRGSSFSNQTTQWLLGKLITLPQRLVNSQQKLFRDNQAMFADRSLLRVENSIDSLAPGSPIFPVMLASRRPPWVTYHNIVGSIPNDSWWTPIVAGGDGVVAEQSARVEDVASEITVPADHSSVHSHPLAVLEVRRILLAHLAELRASPTRGVAAPQTAGVPGPAPARLAVPGPAVRRPTTLELAAPGLAAPGLTTLKLATPGLTTPGPIARGSAAALAH
ncbi:MAG: alpha/beta fold hydrolase [Pirellulales bacterium]|nr:alpha/beta fold hydrolase [Pirellulales bacterium]